MHIGPNAVAILRWCYTEAIICITIFKVKVKLCRAKASGLAPPPPGTEKFRVLLPEDRDETHNFSKAAAFETS
jgi:hypothetical protein